jgi:hypothetical protein
MTEQEKTAYEQLDGIQKISVDYFNSLKVHQNDCSNLFSRIRRTVIEILACPKSYSEPITKKDLEKCMNAIGVIAETIYPVEGFETNYKYWKLIDLLFFDLHEIITVIEEGDLKSIVEILNRNTRQGAGDNAIFNLNSEAKHKLVSLKRFEDLIQRSIQTVANEFHESMIEAWPIAVPSFSQNWSVESPAISIQEMKRMNGKDHLIQASAKRKVHITNA